MTALDGFLKATAFIDWRHAAIQAQLAKLEVGDLAAVRRAEVLFAFVRDQVAYEWMAKGQSRSYVASHVLAEARGFCVQKAVLLCALSRAAGIPTALVICDLQDEQLPGRYVAAMGHSVIYNHGLVAFWLDGRWVKADPALSPDIVQRKGFRPIVFDGRSDALHAATTLDGAPHAAYVRFHGLFEDLPFDWLMAGYRAAYREKSFQVFDADH